MKRTMTINKRYIILFPLALIAAVIIMIIAIWYFVPVTDEDYRRADTTVEREDGFLLIAGGDTLLAFASVEGDSIIAQGSTSVDSMVTKKDWVRGEWVNRLPGFPSCGGRIAVLPEDTALICKATSRRIHELLKINIARMRSDIETIDNQLEHIAYYMKTHNVTDNGFDMVARYSHNVTAHRDSLIRIAALMAAVPDTAHLRIEYFSRYSAFVPTDSDTVRVTCDKVGLQRGKLIIRTSDHSMPDYSTTLSVYDSELLARLRSRAKPKMPLPHHVRKDSLATYYGDMDSIGQSHGTGYWIGNDLTFYEGEWEHGMRHGFGFGINDKGKLSIGEWKDDRFLGERITYTADRIYGIDISRHQHEKGRKRYSIDWSRLAITSLGKKSKKNISGEVNYPISFIYIKSTEGTTIRNKYFMSDYRAACNHHYRTGAYHFFSTRTSGTAQAKYFTRCTLYKRTDMPPVLDIEPSDKQIRQMGGVNKMFKEVRDWLNYVERLWHVRPILYISQRFVNKYLTQAPDLMKSYEVWIARYGEYKPDVNLIYWQLSADGRVRGIHGDVDINVYNGFEMKAP